MKQLVRLLAMCALALIVATPLATAQQAPEADTRTSFGIIAKGRDVINLEKGGKRVVREGLEVLREGAPCKIADNQHVRYQSNTAGGKVLVRVVVLSVAQLKEGHCPQGTPFEIPATEWETAKKLLSQTYDWKKWWAQAKDMVGAGK